MVDVGDRIELVQTDDPHTNREPGDRGTVVSIDTLPPEIMPPGVGSTRQLWISWDDGGRFALLEGKDRFRVVTDEE